MWTSAKVLAAVLVAPVAATYAQSAQPDTWIPAWTSVCEAEASGVVDPMPARVVHPPDCTPPRITHEVRPNLTPNAFGPGFGGFMGLQVLISETGAVSDLRVAKWSAGASPELQAEALHVVHEWRFQPATFYGKPAPTLALITFQFGPPPGVQAGQFWPDKPLNACNADNVKGLTFYVGAGQRIREALKGPNPPIEIAYSPDCSVPTVVHEIQPAYSGSLPPAKDRVQLEGVVKENGTIDYLRIVSSISSAIDSQVIKAVRQWKFEPGTINGHIVPSVVRIEVRLGKSRGQTAERASEDARYGTVYAEHEDGVIPPKLYLSLPAPYTNEALQAKLEGQVELAGVVRPDGHLDPKSVEITQSLDKTFGLDEQAKQWVGLLWRYEPAVCDRSDGCGGVPRGGAVAQRVSIVVNYTLQAAGQASDASKDVPVGNMPYGPVYDSRSQAIIPVSVVRAVDPSYTAAAKKAGIHGTVQLQAIIKPDGRVDPESIKVTRSLDSEFGLDEEAKKVTRQWIFKPAICIHSDGCGTVQKGKPVAVRATFELTFVLR